mgnify:CR=1 FL=1
MKKDFDCVEMKLKIQEQLWKDAGETFEGLIKLHDKLIKESELYHFFKDRKEKEKQLETA